jgi:hypothetical protein
MLEVDGQMLEAHACGQHTIEESIELRLLIPTTLFEMQRKSRQYCIFSNIPCHVFAFLESMSTF